MRIIMWLKLRVTISERARGGGGDFKHTNGFKNPKPITFEISLYEMLKCQ